MVRGWVNLVPLFLFAVSAKLLFFLWLFHLTVSRLLILFHIPNTVSHYFPATHWLFNIFVDIGRVSFDTVDLFLSLSGDLTGVMKLIFILLEKRHDFLEVAIRTIVNIVGRFPPTSQFVIWLVELRITYRHNSICSAMQYDRWWGVLNFFNRPE